MFASTYAVWLRLPMTMAAISIVIPNSLRAELPSALDDLAGPMIDYSGGHYTILTRCATIDAGHIGTDHHYPSVVHLGPNSSVDLPPSITAGTTTAAWLHVPVDDEPLPDCAATLTLVRRMLAD